ncbi:MAG: hypothetical protein Q9195_008066, partial [Heterodermia aff. obscurata]
MPPAPTATKPPLLVLPSTPLPTPLPAHIRTATLNALLATHTIPTLQRTLRDECAAAGWFEAVRARALELINAPPLEIETGDAEGANYDIEAIRAVLVREALGRGEEGEWVDDGAGMMVRKKEEEGRGRGKTDVRLPAGAVEKGTG